MNLSEYIIQELSVSIYSDMDRYAYKYVCIYTRACATRGKHKELRTQRNMLKYNILHLLAMLYAQRVPYRKLLNTFSHAVVS